MDPIYYLIKNNNSGTLSLQTSYPIAYPKNREILRLYANRNVTARSLRNNGFSKLLVGFDYAIGLDEQYASGFGYCRDNDNVGRDAIDLRMNVWGFMQTLNEIKNRSNVVAYSHRYGGWTGVNWQFNEDIKFHISTNFGYGSASYFFSSITYKGIRLCPFSHYIKYRYQSVGFTLSHTFSYNCNYNEWKQCLNDAMEIYNAVVFKKEHAIFDRLTSELNDLVQGLNKMAKFKSISYFYGNGSISGYADVSDDDYIIACSDKMAHAIEFIDAVKGLPEQIQPTKFVNDIINSCESFVPFLDGKISVYSNKLAEKEASLQSETEKLKNFYQKFPIIKVILDKVQSKRYCRTYNLYSDADYQAYCKKIIIRKSYGNRELTIHENAEIQEEENFYLDLTEIIYKLKTEISHISFVKNCLYSNKATLSNNIEKLKSQN